MSEMQQTIPVVNLSDFRGDDSARRESFVADFGGALREYGFVAVEGHGIAQELIDENYRNFAAFFALDDEVKRQYEFPEQGRRRGYTSFGVEHAKDSTKPDLKEFFHLGRDIPDDHALAGTIVANAWPTEVEGLVESAHQLYGQLDDCAMQMLEAFSIYLGLDASTLPDLADMGDSIVRIIHYPVCDGFDEPGVMRAAAHEDINLMTLLPPAAESGLELLTREEQWLPIHAVPGQIIVDTGDMMSRITNTHIPATTHRVVNPVGEPRPRYSMPFFVHPHPAKTLEVFETCLQPGESAQFEPITAGDFLMERLRAIGLS